MLKAHGGGETRLIVLLRHRPDREHKDGFGSYEVEEVENRILAAHAKAVVVSVDYRMVPEYKFPYAINDCFDALKWVCPLPQELHNGS